MLASTAAHAQPAAPVEELREVEEQRGKIEFHLRRVEEKRSAVLAVLEEVESDARAAEAEAKSSRARAKDAEARLARARAEEAEIEGERRRVADELGPRLLLRYRLSGGSYVRALLSAPTLGDFLWRRRMVDRILRDDLALASGLDALQRKTRAALEAVEVERKALAVAEQAAQERANAARERRVVQAGVLAGLVREKSGFERTISELERARRGLLDELAKMPPPPPGLGGFGARRGQLPRPVEGTVEVAFGRHVDPRFKTVLQQKGYDIRARKGAHVLAPHAASVGFAGWFRGYGNLVVLDHGEGYYTLYAHLDELRVQRGDRVEQAAELGTVGDTGSLKGAYLYFEIRSGQKPLDPKEWLAK